MKKIKRDIWVTFVVILLIITLAVFALTKKPAESDEEIVKCIGENSILYTQLGCHACKTQENLFGENYQYLNVVDCFFEKEKCTDITATPTWIIKGKNYIGVQSIEKLEELTGC